MLKLSIRWDRSSHHAGNLSTQKSHEILEKSVEANKRLRLALKYLQSSFDVGPQQQLQRPKEGSRIGLSAGNNYSQRQEPVLQS